MKIKFLDGSEKEFNSLREADLHGANLFKADLRRANLHGANLQGVNIHGADFYKANLSGANLYRANLHRANLYKVNLSKANLGETNLSEANFYKANLSGAKLPHFQICPSEGSFIGWKKTTKGVIKLLIPEHAKRTSSLVGRKCRASSVIPLKEDGINGYSFTKRDLLYRLNVEVFADKFDDDIRVECTHGIHFFMTKKEALEWGW